MKLESLKVRNIDTESVRLPIGQASRLQFLRFTTPQEKALAIKGQSHEENGCIIWDGLVDKDGYGLVTWKGTIYPESWRLNRLSFFLFVGNLIPRKLVCHTCDVPGCWNPEHLYQGTQKNNSQDALVRGRLKISRGEKQGGSKLKTEQVIRIRKLFKQDPKLNSCHKMAPVFGVSFQNIWSVISGKTWRHLPC